MLTAAEIQDLLVQMLAGAAGGDAERWRDLIGWVEVLPLATSPKSNWRVWPSGSDGEIDAIDMAAELVRQEHPHARR